MKKFLSCVLFCSLLFLSGCNNNSASKALKNAETYGYYSVANITSGMTFEDCCKAMGKTEKDFKLEIPGDEDSKSTDLKFYTIDIKLYGKDATLVLQFEKIPQYEKYQFGMATFRLAFKEKTSYEFYITELKKEFEKKGLSYSQDGERGTARFTNKATISTIKDKKVKDKAMKILDELSTKKSFFEPGTAPLDTILLWPSEGNDDELSVVMFQGGSAIVVNAATR